jgi:hypothetical protein
MPVGHPLAEGQRSGRGACAGRVRLHHRGHTRQRVVPGGEEPDPTADDPQGQEPSEPEPEYRKGHDVSLLPGAWITACVFVPSGAGAFAPPYAGTRTETLALGECLITLSHLCVSSA